MPVPKREYYAFSGWYTLAEGGEKIKEDTIISSDAIFYAHWSKNIVAEIGEEKFATLREAVYSVQDNNVKTTIKLLKDTSENIVVRANKNIEFDFQSFTVSNNGDNAVIINNGTIAISNGIITSNADTAAIDNNSSAKLTISGGEIRSTGTRQAIYNNAGTVEISGDAYLSSTATGTPEKATLERATIQSLPKGNIIITGGTIVCETQQAVSNEGTLIVGIKDGTINNTKPIIRGETYGIKSKGTFKFYDGIAKGIDGGISGTISEKEANTQLASGTEVIHEKTYVTEYLEEN